MRSFRSPGGLRAVAIAPFTWLALTARASEYGAAASAVTDYDYRGVSQSANHPALQLEADYSSGALHVEAWTSNVQFGADPGAYEAGHQEIAYSADLTVNAAGWLRSNFGINYATYPGLDPGCNYAETWVTLAHGPVSTSLHYAWDYCAVHPHLGAYYQEFNGNWPLHHGWLAAVAHVGVSWGPYWSADNGGAYLDYALGFSATWHRVNVLAEGINTHGYQSVGPGQPFSGKAKLLLSITLALSSAAD